MWSFLIFSVAFDFLIESLGKRASYDPIGLPMIPYIRQTRICDLLFLLVFLLALSDFFPSWPLIILLVSVFVWPVLPCCSWPTGRLKSLGNPKKNPCWASGSVVLMRLFAKVFFVFFVFCNLFPGRTWWCGGLKILLNHECGLSWSFLSHSTSWSNP